jgi:hypothetical protein
VVFLQNNFLWNKNFIKQESHIGTLCFQYSHFITNKNIPSLFTDNNHRDLSRDFTAIDFGYRFELFETVEDSINLISLKYGHEDFEKINSIVNDSRDNLIYYDFQKLSEPKTLIVYEGELPKNIDMLKNQKIGRINPKKHLVVVGIDTYVNGEYDDFDSLSIISRAKNIATESHKEVLENIKIHYIQVPNEQYYDILIEDNNLKNFQKMYFLNEIKKVLFSQHPLDIDIFEFHLAGNVTSYSWSEIKKNFVYDLLTN